MTGPCATVRASIVVMVLGLAVIAFSDDRPNPAIVVDRPMALADTHDHDQRR
jgi:hypothetical protein